MHIILAVLGAIVTILYLLQRLKGFGIDFSWLNPFHWQRRRAWQKKYSADPLFSLSSTMEAASVLIYTAAKLSGDISREQKNTILEIYETNFKLNKNDAVQLLSSNSFLVKDEEKVLKELEKFLQPSLETFSESQIQSTLELVDKVIAVEERVSQSQSEFKKSLRSVLIPEGKTQSDW